MSYIIFFVIIAIVLFRQNERISRLEKGTKLSQAQPKPSSISESTVSPQTQSGQTVPVMGTTSASAPVAAPARVHSEEASGRLLGRIGIGAVLIGVAFFLKYAFDNNWIGPTGRIMIGIFAGLVFLGIGQWLRKKYLRYSDLLMGGGIAILYLSVYSAHAFYNMIDPTMTIVFMSVVTILAFVMSIVNATQTLALVAIVGGFATPFLAGAAENNMLGLFSYLTLLNLGVLGISFFKRWPHLVAVAFIGTALNFITWFSMYYAASVPGVLGGTMLFLFISFIIFVVASVARIVVGKDASGAKLKADQADYFLLGMNALGFAIMSYTILQLEYHALLGYGAVLVALIYMGVAFLANKFNSEDKALNIFLPGLAVVFLSVAVPLQFSGAWIAVAWFIESCVLYTIASFISNRGFQVMGAVVYVLGILDFTTWSVFRGSGFFGSYSVSENFTPIFNSQFGVLLVAIIAAYAITYMYRRYGSVSVEVGKRGVAVFVIAANILTVYTFSTQISMYYDSVLIAQSKAYQTQVQQADRYNTGYDNSQMQMEANQKYYENISSLQNRSNTTVSIFWALYAALLTAIGFARRVASVRRLGLALFLLTAIKVVIDVWSLGQLYRIISFVVFGIIALAASFAYAKYKDRLKAMVMMALVIGLAAFGSALLGSHAAHASFVPDAWQYQRQITTDVTAGFAKVILPSDISRTANGFSDVRILNQNGVEVSYLVTRSAQTRGGTTVARIVDKATIGGGTSGQEKTGKTRFVADFGQNGVIHSGMTFDIPALNFKRQVSIYSSHWPIAVDDPSGWALVTDKGFIFKFTDPNGSTNDSSFVSGKNFVDFPPTSARYLKVVIGSGDEGAIDVNGVSAYGDSRVETPSYHQEIPVTVFNDPKTRSTQLTVDLGGAGHLTSAIALRTNDTNYSRRVIIESSADASTWSYVGEGSISSVSTSLFSGSSNRVEYPEQKSRFIRASIVNDDNRPLSIEGMVSMEGPIISVVFETRPSETYTLYYGNPKATNPVYDIARISSYIQENTIPQALLGTESSNPSYIAPTGPVVPFTEAHKGLLNGMLVLVVLIIIVAIALYLRSYVMAKKLSQ